MPAAVHYYGTFGGNDLVLPALEYIRFSRSAGRKPAMHRATGRTGRHCSRNRSGILIAGPAGMGSSVMIDAGFVEID